MSRMTIDYTRPDAATAGCCAAGTVGSQGEGVVVCYAPGERFNPVSHECVTRMLAATRLAALKGYGFGGLYDDAQPGEKPMYFVPSRTLTAADAAALGIRSEHDLFGGVVPHAFVATKTITHPLADADAAAPDGWSEAFTQSVSDAVLRGYSAFNVGDAIRAGTRLLREGAVRVKPALALGGRGQSVVTSPAELERAVSAIDGGELQTCGVVLEQNLDDVITYSVGQVRVGELVATYYGTQSLTADNRGSEVYGGSDLIVANGEFDALLALELPDEARRAVTQARRYDEAAHACFPNFFASRRNYDIVIGRDASGARASGVLEQSWRFGGASGAEIAALERFRDDPRVRAVRARCIEIYGASDAPPADAVVYFHGDDEVVGHITKYTRVEPYAHV